LLTTHYIDEADHLADRLIIIAAGRIVADTTPRQLRDQGGPVTIRCPLSDGALAAGLPAALAGYLDHEARTLVIQGDDVKPPLRELVAWADQHHLDLAGLEVGPPALEDAYLATIAETGARQAVGHG
jgi:ABC-2 type transport system ATP-binding protein